MIAGWGGWEWGKSGGWHPPFWLGKWEDQAMAGWMKRTRKWEYQSEVDPATKRSSSTTHLTSPLKTTFYIKEGKKKKYLGTQPGVVIMRFLSYLFQILENSKCIILSCFTYFIFLDISRSSKMQLRMHNVRTFARRPGNENAASFRLWL